MDEKGVLVVSLKPFKENANTEVPSPNSNRKWEKMRDYILSKWNSSEPQTWGCQG